jgi:hypothetical protein
MINPSSKLELFFFIAFCAIVYSCTTPKSATNDNTYKAPGYVKKDFKKILVVARVEQMMYRRKIEDAMVTQLKDRKHGAIASHNYFDPADRGDSAKLMAKIDSLGVDAALVFEMFGQQGQTQERGFFTATMYSVWGGVYYTIGVDSDSRNIQMLYVKPYFITRAENKQQWSTIIEINLSKGIDLSIEELANRTRRSLVGDKIL